MAKHCCVLVAGTTNEFKNPELIFCKLRQKWIHAKALAVKKIGKVGDPYTQDVTSFDL